MTDQLPPGVAFFLEPGEGLSFDALGGQLLFKATGSVTAGRFSFCVRDVPSDFQTPTPHRHPDYQGFFVLEGQVEFVVDGQSRVGGPGFWAFIPPGIAHTYGSAGAGFARVIFINTPAADEYYFGELDEVWRAGDLTAERDRELMIKHRITPAEW